MKKYIQPATILVLLGVIIYLVMEYRTPESTDLEMPERVFEDQINENNIKTPEAPNEKMIAELLENFDDDFSDAIEITHTEAQERFIKGVNVYNNRDFGSYKESWYYILEDNKIDYALTYSPDRVTLNTDASEISDIIYPYIVTNLDEIFYQDRKVDADLESFGPIEYSYYKDSSNVFYDDKKLPLADVDSFEVIKYEYIILGKDDMSVYHEGEMLEGLDPKILKGEKGDKSGYVISDDDTNWYLDRTCDSGDLVSEEEFFQGHYADWDKEKYLAEYTSC